MTMYTCYMCRSVSVLYSISYIEVNLITKRKIHCCENCWRRRMSNGSTHMCECWNREKKLSCEKCEVEFSSFGMHSHSRNYDNWHACFKCLICDASASISPCRCIFPVDLNRYLNYTLSQNVKQTWDLPVQGLTDTVESVNVNNMSMTSDRKVSFPENRDKTENAEIIYFCTVCNRVFSSNEDSINLRRAHTCENLTENRSKNLFVRIKPLKYHKRGCHGERSYTCDTGNKERERKPHLEIHRTIHTNKNPNICEVCNKGFTSSYNLEIHFMTHTDGKPFTCDVCNRSFTRISHLAAHRLGHTALKPYICDICNSGFRQNCHLKTHRMTHTGEKPYVCDVCNKSFNRSHNLEKHRRIHTQSKPYVCDTCSKGFRQSHHLKRHRMSYTCRKNQI